MKRFFLKGLSFLPFLFWVIFLFVCEGCLRACAVLLSVTLHECGHFLAFLILGEKRPRLRVHPLGITLTPRRMLSYRDEMAVAFGGPLANLLSCLLCLPLCRAFPFFTVFAEISFLLAAVHLLPIVPLDGGRISFALCHSLFGESGVRFAAALSFLSLCVSLFFFLYFLLYYGVGLAPLFSVVLLFREQENLRFDL